MMPFVQESKTELGREKYNELLNMYIDEIEFTIHAKEKIISGSIPFLEAFRFQHARRGERSNVRKR